MLKRSWPDLLDRSRPDPAGEELTWIFWRGTDLTYWKKPPAGCNLKKNSLTFAKKTTKHIKLIRKFISWILFIYKKIIIVTTWRTTIFLLKIMYTSRKILTKQSSIPSQAVFPLISYQWSGIFVKYFVGRLKLERWRFAAWKDLAGTWR